MSAICRRSWPRMSAISTTGARIGRWDNERPARREHLRLIEALKLERSSRYLCSEAFITFISKPHDDVSDLIVAPCISNARARRRHLLPARVVQLVRPAARASDQVRRERLCREGQERRLDRSRR